MKTKEEIEDGIAACEISKHSADPNLRFTHEDIWNTKIETLKWVLQ